MKLDFASGAKWCKDMVTAGLASGKKNAPQLMTGGGIFLGWVAAWLFAKEFSAAKEKILEKEQEIAELCNKKSPESLSDASGSLERKDRAVVYIQHCWPAVALGGASTALLVGAQKISLDRLASMYMVTKFLEEKDQKNLKLIGKLKEKAGIKDDSKAERDVEEELIDERYPRDEIEQEIVPYAGSGKTMFIDEVTGNRWFSDILDVSDGIGTFSESLVKKRGDLLKKHMKDDPFYYSDHPFSVDKEIDPRSSCSEVYSALDVGYFLECIGETKACKGKTPRLAELLEFRYYGGGDPVKAKDILRYKEYADPDSGFPVVCYIDYTELLTKSAELDERCPF